MKIKYDHLNQHVLFKETKIYRHVVVVLDEDTKVAVCSRSYCNNNRQ